MRIDDEYRSKCWEKSDINEHLPILKCYAEQCDHVTEFGVRHIVSTWALLKGLPTILASYDLSSPGFPALQYVTDVAKENGVNFFFYNSDVREATIQPTDLLFIDTYHTYTQLTAELARHADKVRQWIIMHDTETFGEKGEADSERGLNPAIAEFLQAHPEWTEIARFTNNNGLTILQRT